MIEVEIIWKMDMIISRYHRYCSKIFKCAMFMSVTYLPVNLNTGGIPLVSNVFKAHCTFTV